MLFTASLLDAMGRSSQPSRIIDVIERGAAHGDVDVAVTVDGQLVLIDFDPLISHGAWRYEGDKKKTRNMVKVTGAKVYRVRETSCPHIAIRGTKIVEFLPGKTVDAGRAMARELGIPPPPLLPGARLDERARRAMAIIREEYRYVARRSHNFLHH